MSVTIYVYLLDEGTDVWRPASADHIRDDIYRITGTPPNDTERWEFLPGEIVRCKNQTLGSGETRLIAREKVAS